MCVLVVGDSVNLTFQVPVRFGVAAGLVSDLAVADFESGLVVDFESDLVVDFESDLVVDFESDLVADFASDLVTDFVVVAVAVVAFKVDDLEVVVEVVLLSFAGGLSASAPLQHRLPTKTKLLTSNRTLLLMKNSLLRELSKLAVRKILLSTTTPELVCDIDLAWSALFAPDQRSRR